MVGQGLARKEEDTWRSGATKNVEVDPNEIAYWLKGSNLPELNLSSVKEVENLIKTYRHLNSNFSNLDKAVFGQRDPVEKKKFFGKNQIVNYFLPNDLFNNLYVSLINFHEATLEMINYFLKNKFSEKSPQVEVLIALRKQLWAILEIGAELKKGRLLFTEGVKKQSQIKEKLTQTLNAIKSHTMLGKLLK